MVINQQEIKVTTEILWKGALVFAIIDLFFVAILVKCIKKEVFIYNFKTSILISTFFVWFMIWLLMSIFFWEPVYHYVFPSWARWIIPPGYGLLFTFMNLLFWKISLKLNWNPIISLCLLGGLLGSLTHIWGISHGLLDKPPMLQGVSPISASIMPIFEFIFYWCLIISIARFINHIKHKIFKIIQKF